jgi:hypothetical protein
VTGSDERRLGYPHDAIECERPATLRELELRRDGTNRASRAAT